MGNVLIDSNTADTEPVGYVIVLLAFAETPHHHFAGLGCQLLADILEDVI